MKLRLVRLNPLTLDPGQMFVMCGRSISANTGSGQGQIVTQFPARLEYLSEVGSWEEVEFTNEFLSDENNDAREVRPEVQVPVYSGPARNKRGGGRSGGGQS